MDQNDPTQPTQDVNAPLTSTAQPDLSQTDQATQTQPTSNPAQPQPTPTVAQDVNPTQPSVDQLDSVQSNELSAPPTPQATQQEPQTAGQTDAAGQTTAGAGTAQEESYAEIVGGDVIDLLDDISTDDTLIQAVAKEMKLDTVKVKAILEPLLDKIDDGQITTEELALIMASTVADEDVNKE